MFSPIALPLWYSLVSAVWPNKEMLRAGAQWQTEHACVVRSATGLRTLLPSLPTSGGAHSRICCGPLIASVFTWDAGGALASDLHSAVGRPRPPGFLQGRQSGALEPRLLMQKPHPGKGAPGAGNHTQRGSQKHVWGIIGKKGFIWVWTLLIMLVLNFQDTCHFRVLPPKKTSVPSSA